MLMAALRLTLGICADNVEGNRWADERIVMNTAGRHELHARLDCATRDTRTLYESFIILQSYI